MIRSIILVPLLAFGLNGAATAQTDRTKELETAKKKYQRDIEKIDMKLLETMDKILLDKKTDKAVQQKLQYDRSVFVTNHIIPTANVMTENYLLNRASATAALMKVYESAIKELNKAKKLDEAMAIDELLKAARGYGLAFPDLEMQPGLIFHIQKSDSDQVMESESAMWSTLLLNKKVGKSKITQCWILEREEKGFTLRQLQTSHYFCVGGSSKDPGALMTTCSLDRKLDTPASSLYRITSVRRDVVIESVLSDLTLTATTGKPVKGVTTTTITQEKKENPSSANQLWRLVVAK